MRPLAIGDADALPAYRSRKDVCRYVRFEPMSRDDVIERIAGQWARPELTDEGRSLTLGAQVGETSELAGDVVLFGVTRLSRTCAAVVAEGMSLLLPRVGMTV